MSLHNGVVTPVAPLLGAVYRDIQNCRSSIATLVSLSDSAKSPPSRTRLACLAWSIAFCRRPRYKAFVEDSGKLMDRQMQVTFRFRPALELAIGCYQSIHGLAKVRKFRLTCRTHHDALTSRRDNGRVPRAIRGSDKVLCPNHPDF